MSLAELIVIAIGLSMDAFAISICKGLSVPKVMLKHMLITGLWFGGGQAVMPLIGYLLGTGFHKAIESIDHWIAFVLLCLIGIGMVKESREESKRLDDSFAPSVMLPLTIADSIDALAAGVTFAFLKVNIIPAVTLIGITTFGFSVAGIWLGNKFGEKYRSKSELLGGLVLIFIGIKILIEHMGVS